MTRFVGLDVSQKLVTAQVGDGERRPDQLGAEHDR
jgi:hypothetical protein